MTLRTGHATDFDFLLGDWHVAHRRLRRRWEGSDDWDAFEGTSTCAAHLGGIANVEEVRCPDRGFSGLTLRSFDLSEQRWSIWWINSTVGRLDPPVRGGFVDGVGTFEGTDTDDGRPVSVRFTWTVADADHARWQQAFSPDGHEWETNWVMDFARR